MPTTLKCCEAGSRVSPPYPVSPFSATFCRRTEASGGSSPYMGIFRIIIRSKIGVSKNYENYSFYSPRFLSPYMGLFLLQRWSVFIIVRSLFARVIKIAHCSFFRTFAHGIIRFGRLSAGCLPASQCGNVGTRTGRQRLVVWGILRSAAKFPQNGAWRQTGRLCPELSQKGLTPRGFAHGSQIKCSD